jgi:hypothetical protein
MSAGKVGTGWGGGMDREPGAGPPGVDRDLELVSAGLSGLRELASDPQKSEDAARTYDFSVRWGVLVSGRLKRLEHYRRAGKLTEEQGRGYGEIRRSLKEALPQLDRLGLARPTVPLED